MAISMALCRWIAYNEIFLELFSFLITRPRLNFWRITRRIAAFYICRNRPKMTADMSFASSNLCKGLCKRSHLIFVFNVSGELLMKNPCLWKRVYEFRLCDGLQGSLNEVTNSWMNRPLCRIIQAITRRPKYCQAISIKRFKFRRTYICSQIEAIN